jgi:uncharacterized protein (UPF0210 family)
MSSVEVIRIRLDGSENRLTNSGLYTVRKRISIAPRMSTPPDVGSEEYEREAQTMMLIVERTSFVLGPLFKCYCAFEAWRKFDESIVKSVLENLVGKTKVCRMHCIV